LNEGAIGASAAANSRAAAESRIWAEGSVLEIRERLVDLQSLAEVLGTVWADLVGIQTAKRSTEGKGGAEEVE
jgi:hypothetical protein